MQINCVRLCIGGQKIPIGAALDLVTTTINHTCDPNAIVFFEGNQPHKLRVRSLKKIAAGEEITIGYIDPSLCVTVRQDLLKYTHVFTCRCKSSLVNDIAALRSPHIDQH